MSPKENLKEEIFLLLVIHFSHFIGQLQKFGRLALKFSENPKCNTAKFQFFLDYKPIGISNIYVVIT